jgi:hypothetical protein
MGCIMRLSRDAQAERERASLDVSLETLDLESPTGDRFPIDAR